MGAIEYKEMPEGWRVVHINKDNTACFIYVKECDYVYGVPVTKHAGELYCCVFSSNILYRIPKEED